MKMKRWNPFREMDEFVNHVTPIWGRVPLIPEREGIRELMPLRDWIPSMDIAETETEFLLTVELPEVRKEDVKVTVTDGILTIEGERKMETEEKTRKFHRVERIFGKFSRTFPLPDDVKEEEIDARHENGMLYLHLPKGTPTMPGGHEIEIH